MRSFFDTNVLVYMFDRSQPQKAVVARELLERCAVDGDAVISIQVLQEFYATVIRKLLPPLNGAEAAAAMRDLVDLDVVEADVALVLDATVKCHRYKLSFWDSLIVEAALRGGAKILYTEDLQDGQAFESLTVRNPFAG